LRSSLKTSESKGWALLPDEIKGPYLGCHLGAEIAVGNGVVAFEDDLVDAVSTPGLKLIDLDSCGGHDKQYQESGPKKTAYRQ
jgi:hypothetical protein